MTLYTFPLVPPMTVCGHCDEHITGLSLTEFDAITVSRATVPDVNVVMPQHGAPYDIGNLRPADTGAEDSIVLDRHTEHLALGRAHVVYVLEACLWHKKRPCPEVCTCNGPRPPEIEIRDLQLHHVSPEFASCDLRGATLDLWSKPGSVAAISCADIDKDDWYHHMVLWNVIGSRIRPYSGHTKTVALDLDVAVPARSHRGLDYAGRELNSGLNQQYTIGIAGYGAPPSRE